eukprot:394175_1
MQDIYPDYELMDKVKDTNCGEVDTVIRKASAAQIESTYARLVKEKIDFIRLEIIDFVGIARGKIIPIESFKRKIGHGAELAEVIYALSARCDITPDIYNEGGYQDVVYYADLSTLRMVPYIPGVARVLIEPEALDGTPLRSRPRFACRYQLDRLKQMGFELKSGFEWEFCLFDKDGEPLFGRDFMNMQLFARHSDVSLHLLRQLREMDIVIESTYTEYALGQLEFAMSPADGIKTADDSCYLKSAVKEICDKLGISATFMTFRSAKETGASSGGHFTHSLWKDDRSVFFDENGEEGKPSDIMRHWIGGLMAHAAALTAFMSPTVNCYRRYQNASWCPGHVTWGHQNRISAFRYKIRDESSTCVENRLPSSAANPYLVMAATLAAGIDGLRRKLEPGEEMNSTKVPEKAMKLPMSLPEALEALKNDTILCEALGKDLVREFCKIKECEIERMSKFKGGDMLKHERDEYFEFI